MNFAYTKYEIQPTSTNPSGVIYRPEVLLRVIGETADAHLMALLDTGADECVLPLSVGEAIGASLDLDETILASGVGGDLLELVPGEVEFELTSGQETYRWRVRVGFARFENPEDECTILGHVGALERFTATFDGENHCGSLVPNASFPGPEK